MNNKSKLIFRAASIASINTQRQRISPWKVSEREFYVILMRLNEMLKMKQFLFCLHGSRLKRNGTFHSSLQKEVQSISRWAGLNQQSANLTKTGAWAQYGEATQSLDALRKLWNAYHEARRCLTGFPNLHTPRGRIPVWGLLWVVLTWWSQPTALTPGMGLYASLRQHGEAVEPAAAPLLPNTTLIPISAEEMLVGSMGSTCRPDPDCGVAPEPFLPYLKFPENKMFWFGKPPEAFWEKDDSGSSKSEWSSMCLCPGV